MGCPHDLSASDDTALAEQALRVHRRYVQEVVERFTFCPYAQRCRQEGGTEDVALTHLEPANWQVLREVQRLAEQPIVEVAFIVFPRLDIDRRHFGRWVGEIRTAHAARNGGRAVMAIEGFHPEAEADMSKAERLTPFIRRTPDPSMQLTRLSLLEKIKRGTSSGTSFMKMSEIDLEALLASPPPPEPLHKKIAAANLETLCTHGVAHLRQVMGDIITDRNESYRRLDPTIVTREILGESPVVSEKSGETRGCPEST